MVSSAALQSRSKSKSPIKKASSRVSNKPQRHAPTKRMSNRGGKKTANGHSMYAAEESTLSKAIAKRAEDLNAFSSLETSNILGEYANINN